MIGDMACLPWTSSRDTECVVPSRSGYERVTAVQEERRSCDSRATKRACTATEDLDEHRERRLAADELRWQAPREDAIGMHRDRFIGGDRDARTPIHHGTHRKLAAA